MKHLRSEQRPFIEQQLQEKRCVQGHIGLTAPSWLFLWLCPIRYEYLCVNLIFCLLPPGLITHTWFNEVKLIFIEHLFQRVHLMYVLSVAWTLPYRAHHQQDQSIKLSNTAAAHAWKNKHGFTGPPRSLLIPESFCFWKRERLISKRAGKNIHSNLLLSDDFRAGCGSKALSMNSWLNPGVDMMWSTC